MNELNFNDPSVISHQCEHRREGDWVIFTCPYCEDYERKINTKTGEMKAKKTWTDIPHQGLAVPDGLQPEKYNPN